MTFVVELSMLALVACIGGLVIWMARRDMRRLDVMQATLHHIQAAQDVDNTYPHEEKVVRENLRDSSITCARFRLERELNRL